MPAGYFQAPGQKKPESFTCERISNSVDLRTLPSDLGAPLGSRQSSGRRAPPRLARLRECSLGPATGTQEAFAQTRGGQFSCRCNCRSCESATARFPSLHACSAPMTRLALRTCSRDEVLQSGHGQNAKRLTRVVAFFAYFIYFYLRWQHGLVCFQNPQAGTDPQPQGAFCRTARAADLAERQSPCRRPGRERAHFQHASQSLRCCQ